ncbi:hypothetical protein [Synechococcus phage Ssp-JY38]|nr:hypothetical protein [Synechococcus phage Yong-L2-223]
MIDFFLEKVLLPVCVIAVPLCLGGLIYAAYNAMTSEKVTLVKHEWECTDTERRMVPVLVGKVLVPTPRTVCVEYRRK